MMVVSALASRAQVEKNDWVLGGSLGFSSNNNDATSGSSTSFSSNIVPSLGWAIAKNAVIGIRGGFNANTLKDETGNKQTNTGYSAGAYWKMYFPFADKAGWYTNLGAGYFHSKTKNTSSSGSTASTVNGYNINLSPGVYYMPTRKILLNGGLGGLSYAHSKYSGGSLTNSGFSFNLLNSFSFGIEFILGRNNSSNNKM